MTSKVLVLCYRSVTAKIGDTMYRYCMYLIPVVSTRLLVHAVEGGPISVSNVELKKKCDSKVRLLLLILLVCL